MVHNEKKPFWRTSISKVEPDKILIRGYPIEDLIGRLTYGEMVYLMFMGEIPPKRIGGMIDALLVAGCEHSITCPSAAAARFVASGGVGLQNAIASGVNALGDHHGGAIEQCMKMLYDAKRLMEEGHDVKEASEMVVSGILRRNERVPGFGHFAHRVDPRVERLLSLGEKIGVSGTYVRLARGVERALERFKGRRFPMNPDGVFAALFCELGFDWRMGRALFTLSRVLGIAAHSYEEMIREKPFRETSISEILYDGPEERGIPEELKKREIV
ncbi:MAG: citryl-CoA lyase [Candidatus Geothermarchaeales archaeon]